MAVSGVRVLLMFCSAAATAAALLLSNPSCEVHPFPDANAVPPDWTQAAGNVSSCSNRLLPLDAAAPGGGLDGPYYFAFDPAPCVDGMHPTLSQRIVLSPALLPGGWLAELTLRSWWAPPAAVPVPPPEARVELRVFDLRDQELPTESADSGFQPLPTGAWEERVLRVNASFLAHSVRVYIGAQCPPGGGWARVYADNLSMVRVDRPPPGANVTYCVEVDRRPECNSAVCERHAFGCLWDQRASVCGCRPLSLTLPSRSAPTSFAHSVTVTHSRTVTHSGTATATASHTRSDTLARTTRPPTLASTEPSHTAPSSFPATTFPSLTNAASSSTSSASLLATLLQPLYLAVVGGAFVCLLLCLAGVTAALLLRKRRKNQPPKVKELWREPPRRDGADTSSRSQQKTELSREETATVEEEEAGEESVEGGPAAAGVAAAAVAAPSARRTQTPPSAPLPKPRPKATGGKSIFGKKKQQQPAAKKKKKPGEDDEDDDLNDFFDSVTDVTMKPLGRAAPVVHEYGSMSQMLGVEVHEYANVGEELVATSGDEDDEDDAAEDDDDETDFVLAEVVKPSKAAKKAAKKKQKQTKR